MAFRKHSVNQGFLILYILVAVLIGKQESWTSLSLPCNIVNADWVSAPEYTPSRSMSEIDSKTFVLFLLLYDRFEMIVLIFVRHFFFFFFFFCNIKYRVVV